MIIISLFNSEKKNRMVSLPLFWVLLFIHNLKNIKLQIIRLIRRPQNRMIWSLRPKLDLTQPFMHIMRRLVYRLGKQFIRHKVGTGAGGKIAPILHQLHSPKINLTVSFCGILNRISRLRKCRRV